MRISLLLQQEPFNQIFENTLRQYWLKQYGREYAIQWHTKIPGLKKTAQSSQRWYGNIYLNFFSTVDTTSQTFSNLKTEYEYTPVIWKKWLQKNYVFWAIHPMLRAALSQMAFDVYPHVPQANDTLILGGNRRFRMLHPAQGTCIVLLKQGYPPHYITEEIKWRNALNLPFVPELIQSNFEQGWYKESYVTGIPLNRLPVNDTLDISEGVLKKLLEGLIKPTLEVTLARDYINQRVAQIEILRCGADNIVQSRIEEIIIKISQIGSKITGFYSDIQTAITHGDFQAGNILIDEGRLIVIDWESVQRRIAAYDLLVFLLDIRLDKNWSMNICRMLTRHASIISCWPGLENKTQIKQTLLIFVLEELYFIVLESYEVLFRKPTPFLESKLVQLNVALEYIKNTKDV